MEGEVILPPMRELSGCWKGGYLKGHPLQRQSHLSAVLSTLLRQRQLAHQKEQEAQRPRARVSPRGHRAVKNCMSLGLHLLRVSAVRAERKMQASKQHECELKLLEALLEESQSHVACMTPLTLKRQQQHREEPRKVSYT